MTDVRILSSGQPDGDVDTHRLIVQSLPRVSTFDEDPIRENRLPLVLAAAFRLLRDRPIDCPIITTGEAALSAASIAWRGPIVHIASAPTSRVELSLLRRRRAAPTRVVASSQTDAIRLQHGGVPAAAIDVIRPVLPTGDRPARDAARAALGLLPTQQAMWIPGTVHRGSGHRLALWAAGILLARDPTMRLLMRDDPRGSADRFAASTLPPRVRIAVREHDDALLAAAADVALFVPDRAPQISALAAAMAAGTPVVSSRALWTREALPTTASVRLLEIPKPRLIARAALEALDDNDARQSTSAFDPDQTRRQWLGSIHAACGIGGITGRVA